MRAAHVRGGLVLAGLLSLSACGGNGSTAVIEAGSAAKSAAPAAGGGGCSTPAYDPTSGTPEPTPLEVICSGDEGAGAPMAPGDPQTSVSSPDVAVPAPTAEAYQVVKPRPGMDNVHPVSWEKADVRTPTSVRVRFWGGVEPCYVLDSVKVSYKAKTVVVTLFSGSDPAKPGVACIDLAKAMAVDVRLSEPLGKRRLVDGASSTGSGTTDSGATTPAPTAPPAGKRAPTSEEGARVVTPRPGMADPQPQSFTSAKATGARTVRVYFMSGVEPCSVLDGYKVTYEAKRVVITLYSGHDPAAGDVSCIMIAESKAVDVTLTEDLGGRELVDGSAA